MKKRKKIFVKLIRNIETIKTVAIILLMVSCVYFGLLIFQYQAMPNSRNLSFFVWDNFEYMSYNQKVDNLSTDNRDIINSITKPAYIVSDNVSGRKIFYRGNDGYDELCDIVDNYIFSIYSGESRVTTEKVGVDEQWIADLESRFVYAKLPLEVNTMLIGGTEYEGNIISKSISAYDEIIMTADSGDGKYGNSTVVYLGSAKSGEKLRIILDRSPLTMLDAIKNREYGAEKEGVFAYELSNKDFSEYPSVQKIKQMMADGRLYIDPMMILPISTVDTHTISVLLPNGYSGGVYSENGAELAMDIAELFGYTENGARHYVDNDGNIVLVDGEKTLEFSKDGNIEFSNSDAHKESVTTYINGIADVYKKLYKMFNLIYDFENKSGVSVVLADVRSYPDENSTNNVITEVSFDYEINGSVVRLENTENNGHFITAKLYNGNLQSLSICVRDIVSSDEISPNESVFTALERFIDVKAQDGVAIRITDMRLDYILSTTGSKCHTKWMLSAE